MPVRVWPLKLELPVLPMQAVGEAIFPMSLPMLPFMPRGLPNN